MNLPLSLPSPPLWAGERVAEGRERGIRIGSWSQCTAARPRGLSLNQPTPTPPRRSGVLGRGPTFRQAASRSGRWRVPAGGWAAAARRRQRWAWHGPGRREGSDAPLPPPRGGAPGWWQERPKGDGVLSSGPPGGRKVDRTVDDQPARPHLHLVQSQGQVQVAHVQQRVQMALHIRRPNTGDRVG